MIKAPKNPFLPMGLGKWGINPNFQFATEERSRVFFEHSDDSNKVGIVISSSRNISSF
jgi:hypothetical protein